MQSQGDIPNVAGRMFELVRQIQRERMGRNLSGPVQNVNGAETFQKLLTATSPNGQEQNAAPASGTLQKERSQKQGRQRDVGQGKTQGRPGQGPQV